MRGLLLLLAATAAAQDNRGFVNPNLVKRTNILASALKAKTASPTLGDSPTIERQRVCAIPLLQAPAGKEVDRGMVIRPDGKVDPESSRLAPRAVGP